jgi:hypothetical protein
MSPPIVYHLMRSVRLHPHPKAGWRAVKVTALALNLNLALLFSTPMTSPQISPLLYSCCYKVEITMLGDVKPGSEEQKLHIFPPMWMANLKDKCICKYICDLHAYTHTHVCIYKENMIAIVVLHEVGSQLQLCHCHQEGLGSAQSPSNSISQSWAWTRPAFLSYWAVVVVWPASLKVCPLCPSCRVSLVWGPDSSQLAFCRGRKCFCDWGLKIHWMQPF